MSNELYADLNDDEEREGPAEIPEQKALAAIKYTLGRIRDSAEISWYMGHCTRVYELLCCAHNALVPGSKAATQFPPHPAKNPRAPQWFRADELPGGDPVLVYLPEERLAARVQVAIYNHHDGVWERVNGTHLATECDGAVTHWAEIPEGPEEGA